MFIYFLLIFLFAFLFFGLVPGIGAFLIRRHWQYFRKTLIQSSLWPILEKASFLKITNSKRPLGFFRFWGKIDSIQATDFLWLKNDNLSVALELNKNWLYLLDSNPRDPTSKQAAEENYLENEPEYLPWKKIYPLPSGLPIFVAGPLFWEKGRFVFRAYNKEQPLIILYNGKTETFLKRCISSGRQRNEYLNQFTPISLFLGSLILVFLSFLFFQQANVQPFYLLPAILSLTLSSFPISFLLPPGFILYFFYRFLWKRSRRLRAERDLLKLPLRFFPKEVSLQDNKIQVYLPNGEKYVAVRFRKDKEMKLYQFDKEPKLQGCSLLSKKNFKSHHCFLFGIEEDRILKNSSDPMVELVCISGNPIQLAFLCNKKAKVLSLLSILSFFSAILINFSLIFIFIYFLLIPG